MFKTSAHLDNLWAAKACSIMQGRWPQPTIHICPTIAQELHLQDSDHFLNNFKFVFLTSHQHLQYLTISQHNLSLIQNLFSSKLQSFQCSCSQTEFYPPSYLKHFTYAIGRVNWRWERGCEKEGKSSEVLNYSPPSKSQQQCFNSNQLFSTSKIGIPYNTHIQMLMHTHAHTYIYAQTHTHTCAHTHVHAHARTHTHHFLCSKCRGPVQECLPNIIHEVDLKTWNSKHIHYNQF